MKGHSVGRFEGKEAPFEASMVLVDSLNRWIVCFERVQEKYIDISHQLPTTIPINLYHGCNLAISANDFRT